MFRLGKTSHLESNIRVHNRIAKKYERMHIEIYNEIEQNRLNESIKNALSYINTDNDKRTVLDFGCGAGNLTNHFVSLGCKVIACDIAQEFLDLIDSRTYETHVKTVKLNGIDLSNIPDRSVDMVAAYSVLHHVPDYIAILKEFMRILKRGGVIYIDHEHSDNVWDKNGDYKLFESEMKSKSKGNIGKYLVLTNYIDWLIRKFINPRYRREGDIHVFEDDHIEWKEISRALVEEGAEVVFESEYLLFKKNYNVYLYDTYKEKVSDMHLLIARKDYK